MVYARIMLLSTCLLLTGRADNICARIPVVFLQDSQDEFFLCNGGTAVYRGPTTNQPGRNVNFSDANWISGVLGLGNFGTIGFRSSQVNSDRRNYFIDVHRGFTNMTSLMGKIYGRDGRGHEVVWEFPVNVPTTSSSTTQIRIPGHEPGDGTSSLDPLVVQKLLHDELIPALQQYMQAVEELNANAINIKDEVLAHAAEEGLGAAIAKMLETAGKRTVLEYLAAASGAFITLALSTTTLASALNGAWDSRADAWVRAQTAHQRIVAATNSANALVS